DRAAAERLERLRGLHHRVGAVGDHVALGGVLLDVAADRGAIGVGEVQAVLPEQRYDVVLEARQPLGQDVPDLRLADFVAAFLVEIDLVDGAAGGEESDEHGLPSPPAIERALLTKAAGAARRRFRPAALL